MTARSAWRSWRDLFAARTGRRAFYMVLVATMVWLAVLASGGARSTTAGFGTGLAWYRYLYTQAWAIARYVRLLFWPSGLIYDYGQEPLAGPARRARPHPAGRASAPRR